MINNTSSNPSIISVINSTPDGLRHRRGTEQPITRIINTQAEIETKAETGPSYKYYKQLSNSLVAGMGAFGGVYGVAAALVLGINPMGMVVAGIGYAALGATTTKITNVVAPKIELKIKQTETLQGLKYKLE